jgi:hypothetical protein
MSDGWDVVHDEQDSGPIHQAHPLELEHDSGPIQQHPSSSPELDFWEGDELLNFPSWALDEPLVMRSVRNPAVSLTKRVCFLCGNKQASKVKGYWRKPQPEFYPSDWPFWDDHAWLDHKCWAMARRIPGVTKEDRAARARPRRRRGSRKRT